MHVDTALDLGHESSDRTVTILRPTSGRPGKRFFINETGQVDSERTEFEREFFHELVPFETIEDLAEILQQIAEDRDALMINGKPRNPSAPTTRRTKRATVDAPTYWLLGDLDRVPNVNEIDPVQEPAGAIAYLETFLTPYQRRVKRLWRFSSSAGIADELGVPRLNAHVYFVTKQPMVESTRRLLLKRWNSRALRKCEWEYGRLVDPKVADWQQELYIAGPTFDAGLEDPFAAARVDRWCLIDGELDELDLREFSDELPDVLMPLDKPGKATRLKDSPEARDPATQESLAGADVVEFVAPERKVLTKRERGLAKRKNRDYQKFARRALEDVKKLIRRRDGGRIEEGHRNIWLARIAMLMSHAVEDADGVFSWRERFKHLALQFVDAEWFSRNWSDSAVLERVILDVAPELHPNVEDEDFTNQEATGFEGCGNRYTPSRQTLIALFGVTEQDMVDYDLEALVTEKIRSDRRRPISRAEYRGAVRAGSKSELAEKLQISRKTLYRWLKSGKIQEFEDKFLVHSEERVTRFDRPPKGGKGMGARVRAREETPDKAGQCTFDQVVARGWNYIVEDEHFPAAVAEMELWRLPHWPFAAGLIVESYVRTDGTEVYVGPEGDMGLLDRVGWHLLSVDEKARLKAIWEDSGRDRDVFRARLLQPQSQTGVGDLDADSDPHPVLGPRLIVDNNRRNDIEEEEIDFGEPVGCEAPIPSQLRPAVVGPISDQDWRAVEDIPF